MCFGSLVTEVTTSLQLTELVGGEGGCVILQAMLLGNLHTSWSYLLGLCIHSVSFRQNAGCTLESLAHFENISVPGAHLLYDSHLMNMGAAS